MPRRASTKHPRRSGQRGLTLLELMMVVVVLTFMASMFLPQPGGSLAQSELRRSAEAVREAFEFARAQAIATGIAHRVSVEVGGGDSPGQILVYQGLGATCQFEFGDDDLLVRHMQLVLPGAEAEVAESDASNVRRIRIESRATIAAISPAVATTDDICMRPDGTVRNARFNQPFSPPAANASAGAGTVLIDVQGNVVSGTTYSPMGPPLRVVLPYNGIARVAF